MPVETVIASEPDAEGQPLYERRLAAIADIATLLGISARALASLARTLDEIAARNAAGPQEPDEADKDSIPRDIDELREARTRRIEAIGAAGHAAEKG